MAKILTSFFVQFTTPEKGVLDSLLNLAGLTASNATESGAIQGRGVLKYEGFVWKNGNIFFGSTKAGSNPNHTVRLQGADGFTVLETWVENEDCRKLLSQCKLTKIGGVLDTPLPAFAKQAELLKPEARVLQKLLDEEGKRTTPALKLTKEQVVLGKSGTSKTVKFTPQGSNLKLEVAFTGSIAREVLNTCMSSRDTEAGLAEGVRDIFKTLPNCAFTRETEQLLVEKFRLSSIRKGRIAPIFTKTKTQSSFLPPKLSRVRANCVAIVNKLTDRVFSLETQEVLLTFLVEPLVEKSTSVEKYKDFKDRIISGLQGGSTDSPNKGNGEEKPTRNPTGRK